MANNFRLFDKLIEGIQVINSDWKYIYVNDSAVVHSKLNREKLLNHNALVLYPGIEKTELFLNMKAVMNDRITKNMINKFEFPDKSIGYFNLFIEPIEEGIMIFSFDITDQKLQEEKLREINQILEIQKQTLAEQSRRLNESLTDKTSMLKKIQEELDFVNSLFQYSTEGLLLTNKQGEIIRINSNAEKMFGYEKNELIGEKIEILIPKRVAQKHEHHREIFNEKPKPRPMGQGIDLYGKRKDDSEFPVEISLSPFTKNNEQFVIAFIIDISIRKKNKDDLRKKNEELEALAKNLKDANQLLEIHTQSLNRSLDEKINLIKEIHHRVRNNLQVIISLIHLQSDKFKHKALETIFNSFESKIETMAMVYNMTYANGSLLNVNLGNFTHNFTSHIISKYHNTKTLFEIEINLKNHFVNIDTAITFGLLLNEILTNAIKFYPSYETPCKIELILKEENEYNFHLKIKDNGSGIPKELLENNEQTIGLFLIDELINQLDGNYQRISDTNGTLYDIKFKQIHG